MNKQQRRPFTTSSIRSASFGTLGNSRKGLALRELMVRKHLEETAAALGGADLQDPDEFQIVLEASR